MGTFQGLNGTIELQFLSRLKENIEEEWPKIKWWLVNKLISQFISLHHDFLKTDLSSSWLYQFLKYCK